MNLRIVTKKTISATGEEIYHNELPQYDITFNTKVSQGADYIVLKAMRLIKENNTNTYEQAEE